VLKTKLHSEGQYSDRVLQLPADVLLWYQAARLGAKAVSNPALPILSLLTPASENDLTCAKGFLDAFHGLNIYADKAYLSIFISLFSIKCASTRIRLAEAWLFPP